MVFAYTGSRAGYQSTTNAQSQDIPIYPDVTANFLKVGTSRRMLQTAILAQSRMMSKEPEPEFPQVDRATAEVRKQFFLARYNGDLSADGSWGDEWSKSFLYGDSLGFGCLQFGATHDRDTGEQKVSCQDIPPTQVIYDRFCAHPTRAKWVCYIHYMDPSDARKMFGHKACEPHIMKMHDHETDRGFDCVRVFEWVSTGIGKGEPTRTVRIGQRTSKPEAHDPNPFGAMIPSAFMVNVVVPGMTRPIGRYTLAEADQTFLNEVETIMLDKLRGGGAVDLIDPDVLDPEDLDRFLRGDKLAFIRITKAIANNPFVRIPEKEISSILPTLLNYAEGQIAADSGFNDLERGSPLDQSRSATEVATIDNRSSMNQAWIQQQTALFLRRGVERCLAVAKVVDRAPVSIDVFGRNVIINQPGRPETWIDGFMEERSAVIISRTSLTSDDDRIRREQEIGMIMRYFELGLVGQTIDPKYATEKLLKLSGEEDVQKAMDMQAMQPPVDPLAQMAAQAEAAMAQGTVPGATAPMMG